MDTAHRRMEIISILSVKVHITSRELAWDTKPGCNGGVFITDNYKPYTNTLTETELETLCRLYGKAEGKEKEILFRIIHKSTMQF